MGDGRTYEDVIAVRAVSTDDFIDGGLVSDADRSFATHLDTHHQQRARRESRGLRCQLEAAQHDRVGITFWSTLLFSKEILATNKILVEMI